MVPKGPAGIGRGQALGAVLRGGRADAIDEVLRPNAMPGIRGGCSGLRTARVVVNPRDLEARAVRQCCRPRSGRTSLCLESRLGWKRAARSPNADFEPRRTPIATPVLQQVGCRFHKTSRCRITDARARLLFGRKALCPPGLQGSSTASPKNVFDEFTGMVYPPIRCLSSITSLNRISVAFPRPGWAFTWPLYG